MNSTRLESVCVLRLVLRTQPRPYGENDSSLRMDCNALW